LACWASGPLAHALFTRPGRRGRVRADSAGV
jgi:hypothetical protein